MELKSNKSERVWNGLKKKISEEGLHDLYSCFLSEENNIEQDMLSYIRYIISFSKNVENNFGNYSVLKVAQTSKKVCREKHRFEAFVRFQLLTDGLYFAPVEPYFNILPLIISHFQTRYLDQKWLIYDLKRKYGIYHDLVKINFVKIDFENFTAQNKLPVGIPHPDERLFSNFGKIILIMLIFLPEKI